MQDLPTAPPGLQHGISLRLGYRGGSGRDERPHAASPVANGESGSSALMQASPARNTCLTQATER